MFVKTRKLAIAVAAGATVAGLLVSTALAGPIEDRQQSMKNQGAAMKVVAEMVKGELLAGYLAHDKELFPEGSETGAVTTRAKPEIWSNKEEFLQRFDKGIVLARELAMITDLAALGPKLSQIGKEVCGACHEKHRLPKE
jgi:cytochrome c556